MGKRVQLRLVDTDDVNINKYILGVVREVDAESVVEKPEQIWGFLEDGKQ